MKIAVFSAKKYEIEFLELHPEITNSISPSIHFTFIPHRLTSTTAIKARDHDAVCIFVNDIADDTVLSTLSHNNIHCLLLRCAGFNHVDLTSANRHHITILRVPAYSPYAVAEFAVALLLTLVRKTHRAYNRSRDSNFSLHGLMGFDIHQKTVGVVGTGKIGRLFAHILKAFGTKVIAYDPFPDAVAIQQDNIEYTSFHKLLQQSDIISLHCPMSTANKHMINTSAIQHMKDNVVLINTSRGELIDLDALISALRSKKIGACAMDVVEGEQAIFFDDHSGEILDNHRIATLMTFPNVIVTPHLAFCTDTAMTNIWSTTVQNMVEYYKTRNKHDGNEKLPNEVTVTGKC